MYSVTDLPNMCDLVGVLRAFCLAPCHFFSPSFAPLLTPPVAPSHFCFGPSKRSNFLLNQGGIQSHWWPLDLDLSSSFWRCAPKIHFPRPSAHLGPAVEENSVFEFPLLVGKCEQTWGLPSAVD